MTTTIPIVGLAANDPVPGNYVSVQFAAGQASAGQTDYSAILLGNCLSGSFASGSAGTVVYGAATTDKLDSEQDAIDLFGAGSELHLMFRDFRAINKTTSLFAIPVPESTGAKATGTITVTGTATAPATVRIWIGDEQLDAGIAVGDTATDIGDAIVDAINERAHLPVTASNSTGTVTITAKQKGLRGNQIRYSAKVYPAANTGVSITPSARTLMTGGTTADDNSSALSTISSSRYYYYISAAEDSTQLDNISDQLDEMAAPTVGLRQRCVAGSQAASVSDVQTIAIALNNPRVELVYQASSDLTPARIAAKAAAVYSLMEQGLGAQSSLNYNSFGSDAFTSQFWRVPAPISGIKLSRSQVKSALMNGVTPITTTPQGGTYLVRRITTRSLNGASPDYRIRDAHKVTVADRFADDLIAQATARFAGKVVGDDVTRGQRAPGNNIVTPRLFKSMVFDLINTYDQSDLLQDVDGTLEGVVVVREPNAPTRISCRIPLKVVDILNSTGTQVDEISQG